MVAGESWIRNRALEVCPLEMPVTAEHCSFTFGPSEAKVSKQRFRIPAGIGGQLGELRMSCVPAEAPGLFSRPGFETLHALPDVVTGQIHFQALRVSVPLYLANGHIAFRIDNWPENVSEREWPLDDNRDGKDVYFPSARPVASVSMQAISSEGAAVRPPVKQHAPKNKHAPAVASAMAATSEGSLRLRSDGRNGDTLLRSHQHEVRTPRQDSATHSCPTRPRLG